MRIHRGCSLVWRPGVTELQINRSCMNCCNRSFSDIRDSAVMARKRGGEASWRLYKSYTHTDFSLAIARPPPSPAHDDSNKHTHESKQPRPTSLLPVFGSVPKKKKTHFEIIIKIYYEPQGAELCKLSSQNSQPIELQANARCEKQP
jgi:hypothetical protein